MIFKLPMDRLLRILKGRNLIPEDGLNMREAVRQLEIILIEKALKEGGGSQKNAAALLHIARPRLIEKMKKYGIWKRTRQERFRAKD